MTGAEGPPAVRYHDSVITDVDEANELVRSRYVDYHPSFFGDRDRFHGRLTSTAVDSGAGWFCTDRWQHTLGVHTLTEPPAQLLVTAPVTGHVRRAVGREDTSSPSLVPYWARCVTRWEKLDSAIGVLELGAVRRLGAANAGLDPAAVEFLDWRPISPDGGDLVVATLGYIGRAVRANGVAVSSPLVRAEMFRHLASVVLAAFPNTAHAPTEAGRDTGEPACVRRAVEFVDAHAHEDLDVARIADAARIGTRGLQAAFRRHRGQTPTEYLRRVRMERAHRDLQTSDATRGATVAGIAAGWGFGHPGRFSVEYRQLYGRPPSRTLRE